MNRLRHCQEKTPQLLFDLSTILWANGVRCETKERERATEGRWVWSTFDNQLDSLWRREKQRCETIDFNDQTVPQITAVFFNSPVHKLPLFCYCTFVCVPKHGRLTFLHRRLNFEVRQRWMERVGRERERGEEYLHSLGNPFEADHEPPYYPRSSNSQFSSVSPFSR